MLEDYEKAQVSTNLTCICSLAKSDEDQVGLDDYITFHGQEKFIQNQSTVFFF